MSQIRVALLASASTLASVVVTEVHGVAIGVVAGCAALAAGAAAWSSSERKEKNTDHPHERTKKALDFCITQKITLRSPEQKNLLCTLA